MPKYLGECSDCGIFVDSKDNGDCFSGAPLPPAGSGVFLVCKECQIKRGSGSGWKPGKKHNPASIRFEP